MKGRLHSQLKSVNFGANSMKFKFNEIEFHSHLSVVDALLVAVPGVAGMLGL